MEYPECKLLVGLVGTSHGRDFTRGHFTLDALLREETTALHHSAGVSL